MDMYQRAAYLKVDHDKIMGKFRDLLGFSKLWLQSY